MHLTHWIYITISLLITFTSCQDYIACGTDPGDRFSANSESQPMCFKFKNIMPGTGGGNKYYFSTLVDKYTLIQLVDSNLGETANSNATQWRTDIAAAVALESGNVSTSDMYIRYQDDSGQWWAFSQLTAVILLTDGKIDEIVWDEGCYACDADHCVNGNCATRFEDCSSSGDCDFSAYISWYGTDSNGQYLLSAGQRLSQFQSVSAKSYYDYVKDNFDTSDLEFDG